MSAKNQPATERSYILEGKKTDPYEQQQTTGETDSTYDVEDTKQIVPSSPTKQATSSLPHASFNYINSIIGSGVIGLPYALYQCGFGLGIILLFVVAFITDYSLILMVRGGVLSGTSSYQGLMEAAFGKPGFIILSLLQFIYPFIAMISYNVIVGDTVTKVVGRLSGLPSNHFLVRREFIVLIATLLLTLPLSLYRDVARMARVSFLSLVFIVFVMVTIWIRLFTMKSLVPTTFDAWNFANTGILQGIGIMAFAFMCHHNTFLLYGSIEDASPQRWDRVTHASLFTSLLLSLLYAVGGYLNFTGNIQGDLFENYCYDDDLMNISRCLFCITVLLTFPIECFVSREVVENIFFPRDQPAPMWRHIVVTVALVVLACLLSLMTDCLGIVLELNGLLAAVPLAYILPSLSYCKVAEGSWFSREKVPALATALFGVVVAVAGFIAILLRGWQATKCSHGHDMLYCGGGNDTAMDAGHSLLTTLIPPHIP